MLFLNLQDNELILIRNQVHLSQEIDLLKFYDMEIDGNPLFELHDLDA